MLVSIVTPSFNQAAFIEAALRSVLAQGYPRLEYMVVDGGSRDGSPEIIRRYADRLAWWVSEPDGGQADAINKGLRRSRGEIVAWLNSDDLYLPDAIARAVRAFEAHPQAGLVFGDLLAIDAQGKSINLQRFGHWGLRELMSFRIIGQPSVFMRRSVLERAGWLDPAYHLLLDHHLWIRMARLAEICYLPEALAAARFHPEAKNTARAAGFGEEAFRILDWMRTQADLAMILSEDQSRIIAGAHRLNGYYLVEGGRAAAGLKAYGHALALHPATALKDWKRILLAVSGMAGLNGLLRGAYTRLRRLFNRYPQHPE